MADKDNGSEGTGAAMGAAGGTENKTASKHEGRKSMGSVECMGYDRSRLVINSRTSLANSSYVTPQHLTLR